MNVVFFSHDADVYGASRSLVNLIEGLKCHKVNSYVILPKRGRLEKLLKEAQIPYSIIHNTRWVTKKIPDPSANLISYLKWRWYALRKVIASLRRFPRLRRQIKDWNVDIIYTNSSVIWIGIVLAWVTKLPHVWHIREFKDLDQGVELEWGKKWFDRALLFSKANIFISQSLKSHIYKFQNERHAHVVPNGVAWEADFDKYYDRVDPGSPFRFLIIGTIHESKGQLEAIRAFAKVHEVRPDTRLLVVGRGAVEDAKALADHLNITPVVEFWGHVDDPSVAYRSANAVLVCSRNEAFGRVTAEAMAHRLPVIGRDSAGTSEIVTHMHTGLLYRHGPDELATHMIRIIDDSDLRTGLAHNGWQHARQEYSIEKYSNRIHSILEAVTQQTEKP